MTLLSKNGGENPRIMATEEKVLRYTLTRKDLFAFNLYVLLRNRLLLVMMVCVLAFIMYMSFNTPLTKPEPPLAMRIVFVSLIGLISLVLMSAFLPLLLFVMLWTKKFKNVLGEHELRLTDAGMTSRSEHAESTLKWSGLFKVVSTSNYLYLFVNETAARPLPKRCFASPTEAQGFEQMIRERMKQ